MIYGYIRVSTDRQTCKNQKLAIREYCKAHRLRNIQWVSETISGTKKPDKRKLGKLLNVVQTGDTIICTELSRLGRSLMMILNVLQELLESGVKVIAIKFSQKFLLLHSDFRRRLNALCCRNAQSRGLNAPAKRESR